VWRCEASAADQYHWAKKKQKLMEESLERRLVHDSMIEFRASEAVQQQEQAAHL